MRTPSSTDPKIITWHPPLTTSETVSSSLTSKGIAQPNEQNREAKSWNPNDTNDITTNDLITRDITEATELTPQPSLNSSSTSNPKPNLASSTIAGPTTKQHPRDWLWQALHTAYIIGPNVIGGPLAKPLTQAQFKALVALVKELEQKAGHFVIDHKWLRIPFTRRFQRIDPAQVITHLTKDNVPQIYFEDKTGHRALLENRLEDLQALEALYLDGDPARLTCPYEAQAIRELSQAGIKAETFITYRDEREINPGGLLYQYNLYVDYRDQKPYPYVENPPLSSPQRNHPLSHFKYVLPNQQDAPRLNPPQLAFKLLNHDIDALPHPDVARLLQAADRKGIINDWLSIYDRLELEGHAYLTQGDIEYPPNLGLNSTDPKKVKHILQEAENIHNKLIIPLIKAQQNGLLDKNLNEAIRILNTPLAQLDPATKLTIFLKLASSFCGTPRQKRHWATMTMSHFIQNNYTRKQIETALKIANYLNDIDPNDSLAAILQLTKNAPSIFHHHSIAATAICFKRLLKSTGQAAEANILLKEAVHNSSDDITLYQHAELLTRLIYNAKATGIDYTITEESTSPLLKNTNQTQAFPPSIQDIVGQYRWLLSTRKDISTILKSYQDNERTLSGQARLEETVAATIVNLKHGISLEEWRKAISPIIKTSLHREGKYWASSHPSRSRLYTRFNTLAFALSDPKHLKQTADDYAAILRKHLNADEEFKWLVTASHAGKLNNTINAHIKNLSNQCRNLEDEWKELLQQVVTLKGFATEEWSTRLNALNLPYTPYPNRDISIKLLQILAQELQPGDDLKAKFHHLKILIDTTQKLHIFEQTPIIYQGLQSFVRKNHTDEATALDTLLKSLIITGSPQEALEHLASNNTRQKDRATTVKKHDDKITIGHITIPVRKR